MRNINQLVSGFGVALIAIALLTASAVAQSATIAKIVGGPGATVIVGGQPQTATEHMSVPLNAEIRTTGQEVYLEVVPGVVASVKPNSDVVVESLAAGAPQLFLSEGSVVSQIDRTKMAGGKEYRIRTARGVAAARGTAFSVSISADGFSIAATADRVVFTPSGQPPVTIQAGQITYTPPGATAPVTMSIAQAVQQNPQIATVVTEAVRTVTTVVQNNLGQISAESATNVIAQVVAVAVAAVPSQATTFTAEAVTAVTASGSATATSPDAASSAAGTVTAAAVKASPDQASQIAGAAAAAAPQSSGVITAAAQQSAPSQATSITEAVAQSTGQSTGSVQSNADASSSQASASVSTATNATQNVVTPPNQTGTTTTPTNPTETPKATEKPTTTPQIPSINPDQSPAGAG